MIEKDPEIRASHRVGVDFDFVRLVIETLENRMRRLLAVIGDIRIQEGWLENDQGEFEPNTPHAAELDVIDAIESQFLAMPTADAIDMLHRLAKEAYVDAITGKLMQEKKPPAAEGEIEN